MPSPYATLWAFVDSLHGGSITSTLPLVSSSAVISAALKGGLARSDLQWITTGRETDTTFDLRSKEASLRVTLAQQGTGWIVTAIGPVPAQGKILFTGTRPVVRGLFSMDTSASSPPASLGDGQRYAWSPDYARIAYDWQGQIYVADSDGSKARALGPGVAPAWSPDGKRLAIERASDRGPRVIVINLEDRSETVVAGGSRPAWAPTQTAASQRVAFASSGSTATPAAVYLADLATGSTALLASDGSEPLWSPDGSAIAFLTSRREIAVVTLVPLRVTTVGAGAFYTWSVDGKRLAFLGATPAGTPMVWDRENQQTRTLLERNDVDGLAWSPDGKEIVVSVAGGGGLWLASSDGSNLRKLGDGRDPVWAWPPRAGR